LKELLQKLNEARGSMHMPDIRGIQIGCNPYYLDVKGKHNFCTAILHRLPTCEAASVAAL